MECRPLKITLMSAEDLEYVNHVSTMSVYAVVTINGDPKTKLKTPVDKKCGSNPKWKYTITFIVEESAADQNLVICLWSKRTLGDTHIGEVRVPIKEFLDRKGKVVYNVSLPNGEEKGRLNLCCKIGKKFSVPVAAPAHVTERRTSAETPVVASPTARSRAGYQPVSPAAYPYNFPQQGAYAYPYNFPQQGASAYPHSFPQQGAYPHSFPQQGAYPHNFPQQGAYPPQQPPHVFHSSTPAQGQWYTGPLHAWHGYMPPQQPQAGLGHAPAGGLLGGLYIVGMLPDVLANFTSMLNGDWLEGLFNS